VSIILGASGVVDADSSLGVLTSEQNRKFKTHALDDGGQTDIPGATLNVDRVFKKKGESAGTTWSALLRAEVKAGRARGSVREKDVGIKKEWRFRESRGG